MTTIDLLTGPASGMMWPGVIAAIAIAAQCAVLSVFIVLKRLAFLGQGVTHAAFGGVGIAAILGLSAGAGFIVVAAFCVASAVAVGALTERKKISSDTAIALLLVGSMALGAVLLHIRLTRIGPTPMARGWESLLFGSILTVQPADAALAWIALALIAFVLFMWRRALIFWAFESPAAQAYGVATGAMRIVLLVLAAIAIVVSMKLAGVVLATALLVLPGAAALQLSRRLGAVFVLAVVIGEVGALGGLALSFETDLPAGPCIVGCLAAILALSWAVPTGRPRTLEKA